MKKTNIIYCLTFDQYKYILYISFISLFSCIYGLYNNKIDYALIVPGGVFITSIINWCNPMYDWRRYLDIIYVVFAYIYATLRVVGTEYEFYFHIFMTTAIMFFFIGYYSSNKNYLWYSVIFHMCVHIFANIANIIVLSGNISPINKNYLFNYLSIF